MAVFDAVVNNADRKGGHVLAMTGGHRYGVDHGLTFHVEHKLRTVLWGWAGELARPTRTAPASSSSPTGSRTSSASASLELVTPHEVEATRRRVKRLLRVGHPARARPGVARDPVATLLTPGGLPPGLP